ncbi:carboxylate-amine ligase [Saccharothrix australiensis]|uniref:Putative glutamate--cysteine ligase 2 n=1 Tax=Saccharothrix australiensis TaxID=2072 RepID=A0A495VZC5_9PSEU|nr:glutamate--cysteine ligase [Saccharothrix australiensis]RKT54792.1 carboxylate-amine ligase [Saccharothrix australiensis]
MTARTTAAATPSQSTTTVGVEEEFLLVDATTRQTAARAADVLARTPALPAGAKVDRELLTTQVEFASGVCTDLDELHGQLLAGRRALVAAAGAEGALVVPSGTPVLAGPVPPLAEGDRFTRISALYGGQVADYQCCGCHVHVGVPDRDTAVAVVNHLRPWLPTLLALSVNSPFAAGRDTGFGSWRMVEQARFPGSGVPPRFGSAAEHDAAVARLAECGVLVDEAMTFWLARPSPRYPTVEVRAADAAVTAADAVLQAGLTRALVDAALADLAAGREAPALDDQVLAAAVWSAARHGLGGPGVDPWRGVPVPAADLLRRLVEHVSYDGPVWSVVAGGTGADRQRRAADGGPVAVVDALAAACISAPDGGNPRR